MKIKTKKDRRRRIHLRMRKRVVGTAERPRLAVFRSLTNIYVQAIGDAAGGTTEVVINALLDRLPNLRLDPAAEDVHIAGRGFRAPRSLPVLFG